MGKVFSDASLMATSDGMMKDWPIRKRILKHVRIANTRSNHCTGAEMEQPGRGPAPRRRPRLCPRGWGCGSLWQRSCCGAHWSCEGCWGNYSLDVFFWGTLVQNSSRGTGEAAGHWMMLCVFGLYSRTQHLGNVCVSQELATREGLIPSAVFL